MVVRILGEGQFDLEGSALQDLKVADAELFEAVAAGDEGRFAAKFGAVLQVVRHQGRPVPTDRLVESDLVLPAPDTTLDEARRLFTGHPH